VSVEKYNPHLPGHSMTACHDFMMKRGYSSDSAWRICAALRKRSGGKSKELQKSLVEAIENGDKWAAEKLADAILLFKGEGDVGITTPGVLVPTAGGGEEKKPEENNETEEEQTANLSRNESEKATPDDVNRWLDGFPESLRERAMYEPGIRYMIGRKLAERFGLPLESAMRFVYAWAGALTTSLV
jgi:hypothetical protein